MRRLLLLLAVLLAAPVFATTPVAINTLNATAPGKAPQLHIVLSWAVPALTGLPTTPPASYDIRYSTDCTDLTPEFPDNYGAASVASLRTLSGVAVTPGAVGATQSIEVVGLKPNTTYCFAMKSQHSTDVSAISNIVSRTTAKYEGEGFASDGGGALGDRGADYICRVNSLTDDGVGQTLRECIFQSDRGSTCTRPLTILTTVGGKINLTSDIVIDNGTNPLNTYECKLTLDGSMAPDPGTTIGRLAGGCSSPTCPTDRTCLQDAQFAIGQDTASAVEDVIVTYIRFQGNHNVLAWGFCGIEDSTTIGLQYNVSDVVLDHLTIRNGADSSPDVYSGTRAINRVSYLNNLVAWNAHPMLVGGSGSSPVNNVTIARNVIAKFIERGALVRGPASDIDFRNNIIYDWAGEGMLVQNDANGDPTINIINNQFEAGGLSGNEIKEFSLMYGRIAGEDDGAGRYDGLNNTNCWPGACTRNPCTNCPSQGTVLDCTNMGAMWVNGNTFSHPVCDVWSTVTSARSPTAGAEVTTVAASLLESTILGTVGTHYRTAAETALLLEIGPVNVQTCGNQIKEGTEACDSPDFGLDSCQVRGFEGGSLTCTLCTTITAENCTTSVPSHSLMKGVKLQGGTIK